MRRVALSTLFVVRALVALIAFGLASAPTPSRAQSNASDAALEGFVTDPSGAAVPAARVMALNLGTNQVRETVANREGYFRFPLLQVGEYEVLVSAQGFADYQQTGIRLSVGEQARVDVALGIAGTTETVTVTADASAVLAGQAASGEVLNERAVRSLPITSRNIYNFHLVGPGVKGMPSTGFGTTQFLVGGHDRMTWSMDGIDNSQRRFNRQIRLVISTPENVEEMQVLTGAYSAEFGRAAGGVINVVSRSGSNQVKGGGSALVRPKSLSARPPLASSKPDQKWWMVQGNVGGPVVRDRVFFFANYEYNPLKSPQPVTINPAAAAAIGLGASDLGNSPFGETFHTPSLKVNFRLNDANSGFVRYNRFTNDQPGGGGGLTAISRSLTFKDRMNGVGAQLATTLGPSLLNELRFGFNRRAENRDPYVDGDAGGANVNISGVANFGVNPLAANNSVEASLQVIDNVTWTRGRHTVKTGLDFQTTQYDVHSALSRVFTFTGLAASGGRGAVSPLDQYLRARAGEIDPATGRPYTFTQLQQQIGDPDLSMRFNYLNLFLQDEVRLRSDLTMSAGLRYELIMYPVLDAEAPYALSRRVNNDTNNVAPRVGLTWRPGGSEKTAVRAGYGLYYDSTSLNLVLAAAQNNGRRILSYVVPGSDPRAPIYPNLLATGNPSFATPPSITVFPEDFQTMYAHQASVTIDRQLTGSTVVSAGYSFWNHRNAPYSRDINLGPVVRTLEDGRPVYSGAAGRPDPAYRAINLVESLGTARYHGVDVSLRQRLTRGLQFSVNYGWASARGNSDMEGGAVTDPSNVDRDLGRSAGDLRHNVTGQATYTPEGDGALRWLNGFEFSTLVFYNSGFPVNATAGLDLNNDLVLNDRRPGVERNGFDGPDYFQVDLRISRRIHLGPTAAVDLMLESENLLNRLNANCSIAGCTGAVVSRDGAADFLRITATRPGRYVQLGARFLF
ncbi:MAG: carboxypeptidase regulatory-like domain-containing protein [Vicinamibacterales bacterium]